MGDIFYLCSLFVFMCMCCMYLFVGVLLCACMFGGQKLASDSSTFTPILDFETGTWSSLFWLKWVTVGLWGSLIFFLPQCWDYRHMLSCTAFMGVLEILNLGLMLVQQTLYQLSHTPRYMYYIFKNVYKICHKIFKPTTISYMCLRLRCGQFALFCVSVVLCSCRPKSSY